MELLSGRFKYVILIYELKKMTAQHIIVNVTSAHLEAESAVLFVVQHPKRKYLGIDDGHHRQDEVERRR